MTFEFARAFANVFLSGGEFFCCLDVKVLVFEMYDVVVVNDDFIIDEVMYV